MYGYREQRPAHYTSKRIYTREFPVKGSLWLGAQVPLGNSFDFYRTVALTGGEQMVLQDLPRRYRVGGVDGFSAYTRWVAPGPDQSIIPLTIPCKTLYGRDTQTFESEAVGADFINWPRQLTPDIKAAYNTGYWRLLEADHELEVLNHTSVPVIFYMRMMRGSLFPALPGLGSNTSGPYSEVYGDSDEWQRFVCPAATTLTATFNQDAQPPGRLRIPIKLSSRATWNDAGWRDERPSDAGAGIDNWWKPFVDLGANAGAAEYFNGAREVAVQIVSKLDHPKIAAASTSLCVKFVMNYRWKIELAKVISEAA